MVADLLIYFFPPDPFFLSDSSLETIRGQIYSILLTSVEQENGPFADLQPEPDSLTVNTRKLSQM